MRFGNPIEKKYRRSIEQAFETILEKGSDFHRKVIEAIIESEMLVGVHPVAKIKASGITGLINSRRTNDRIQEGERLSVREAFGEVFMTIAEETIDAGGQRGCEGTLVHEGRHAFDFAQTIASFSDADVNPLSVFNPTLYELELEAHRTAGEYMLCIGREEYLREGLDLMILGQNENGFFLDEEGIKRRLRESYGLAENGHQGKYVSQMFGLMSR